MKEDNSRNKALAIYNRREEEGGGAPGAVHPFETILMRETSVDFSRLYGEDRGYEESVILNEDGRTLATIERYFIASRFRDKAAALAVVDKWAERLAKELSIEYYRQHGE